jgi:hypothetical protein
VIQVLLVEAELVVAVVDVAVAAVAIVPGEEQLVVRQVRQG